MRRGIAAALAGILLVSLTACGQTEEFDAKGYVEGVLDATYKSDYAAHAEDVGEDEKDIQAEMEESNRKAAEDALADSGISATDAEIDEYIGLIEEGYKKIGYEVKNVEKDENDNFTVEVEVTPVGILDSLEEIFTEKLTDAVNNGTDESGYMAVFNESVKESINQAQTLDPQTVTLNVAWSEDDDGNHVYEINESDLDQLDKVATNQL